MSIIYFRKNNLLKGAAALIFCLTACHSIPNSSISDESYRAVSKKNRFLPHSLFFNERGQLKESGIFVFGNDLYCLIKKSDILNIQVALRQVDSNKEIHCSFLAKSKYPRCFPEKVNHIRKKIREHKLLAIKDIYYQQYTSKEYDLWYLMKFKESGEDVPENIKLIQNWFQCARQEFFGKQEQ